MASHLPRFPVIPCLELHLPATGLSFRILDFHPCPFQDPGRCLSHLGEKVFHQTGDKKTDFPRWFLALHVVPFLKWTRAIHKWMDTTSQKGKIWFIRLKRTLSECEAKEYRLWPFFFGSKPPGEKGSPPLQVQPFPGSGVTFAMQFCDHHCRFATWPEKDALDGSGSCRTFQAVYCSKKNRPMHKNMPCPEKESRDDPSRNSASPSGEREAP
jgi:hypothetical protein